MSPLLSLLFSFSFLFLAVIQSRGTALLGTSSPNCPSYNCSGVTVGYPFWSQYDMNSTTYCGYPGFGLGCWNHSSPIFGDLHDYYVRNISYSDRTFTLVDTDVTEQQCPRPRHNLTFGNLPLYYSDQELNLTFYFNCTTSLPLGTFLPCLEYGTERSYVFVSGNEPKGFELCEERVVATVLRREVDFSTFSYTFGAALVRGFVLNWGVQMDCAECENSNGRCGSDKDGNEFHCFCLDGRVEGKHCGAKGGRRRAKFLIVFGASGATMVVESLIFCIYRRGNGRKNSAFYNSYRLNLSDPSSLKDLEKAGVLVFGYNELEKATTGFDPDMELGKGGFGAVYKGKLQDGRVVAVKRLYENSSKHVEQFVNEIEILMRLRHRNLVTLYGCSTRHSRELLFVYEYVPNGTLADHLHGHEARPNRPDWPTRLTIAVETASSLAYLHASDVIHRDVKSSNILLDENFHAKVADFGISRLFPADATHISTTPLGTPGYLDPDYYESYQVTAKSDVYSFGVVLVELMSSKPAVDFTRHHHEINLSYMALRKIRNDALHELVDSSLGYESDSMVRRSIRAVAGLAFWCLQGKREMRPLMDEVLDILSRIQSQEYFYEGRDDGVFPVDDGALLKNYPLTLSLNPEAAVRTSTSTVSNSSW